MSYDAFIECCINGDIDTFNRLLNDFEELNKPLIIEDGYLHALEFGKTEIVKLFIENNIFNFKRCKCISITIPCQKGYIDLVKYFMDKVDPSIYNDSPIRYASLYGHFDIVRLLMNDKRVNPAALINESIIEASACGYVDIVKILLTDSRVDPSANDSQALRASVKNGHINVVKLLLKDKRVDPTKRYNEAIYHAIAERNHEMVRLLLTHICDYPPCIFNDSSFHVDQIIKEDSKKRIIWNKICNDFRLSEDIEKEVALTCFIHPKYLS
jgi:ankyrin repeat protein